MKKSYVPVAVILLVLLGGCEKSSSDFDKNGENDLIKRKLVGEVRSTVFTIYDAVVKFGEITKDENIVHEKEYSLYNPGGYLIEDSTKVQWNLHLVRYYSYNEDNLVTEVNTYKPTGEFYSKGKYYYDEITNKLEEIWYDSEGALTHKYLYDYDQNNNMIETRHEDSDGNLVGLLTYVYDDMNIIIERNSYGSNNQFLSNEQYSYDSNGNRIEIKRFDQNNNLERILTSKFNEKNLVTEFKVRDADGNPTQKDMSSEFLYDANGNWTVVIQYYDGDLRTYSERIIEYY